MLSPRLILTGASLALFLAPACGDEGSGADGGGGPGLTDGGSSDGTTGADTTDGGATGGGTTGDGGTAGGGTTGSDTGNDTGTDPMQILARGVGISDMFANQGVRVQVVDGGAVIPAAQRPVDLVAGRPSLIRAYWDISDGFEPRLIQGRLYVDPGSGEETMYSSVAMVEGESYDGDVGRSFSWVVDGDDMTADMGFRVELWEAKPGQEGTPEPDPAPIYPPEGTVSLGVSAKPMTMKVTIVRIAYDGRTPEFTPEQEEKFYRYMYEQNPLRDLELHVHPQVLSIPGSLSSFSQVLGYVQDWHDSEVGYDHYYYGVIDTGTPDLGGAGGMAWSTVSAGLWWQNSGKFPFKTFVHEIGHNQGRPHSPGCGAGSPDYSYPDAEGRTLTWGFGVMSKELKHPNLNHDYMSYCDPQWVSEWTWVRTADVIASLSGPPGVGLPPGQTGRVLIGYQDAADGWHWRTASGVVWPEEMTGGERVEMVMSGGEVVESGARVQIADDGTTVVVAPAPTGEVVSVTWTGAAGVVAGDLAVR